MTCFWVGVAVGGSCDLEGTDEPEEAGVVSSLPNSAVDMTGLFVGVGVFVGSLFNSAVDMTGFLVGVAVGLRPESVNKSVLISFNKAALLLFSWLC
jgi:hypothetical protein